MIPVHKLTTEQAVLEMEQLADSRPPEDQVLERIHWDKANLTRMRELEAWVLHDTSAPTSKPIPTAIEPTPEAVLPVIENSPQDSLQKKTARYAELIQILTADPGNKVARNKINSVKFDIRALAKREGIATPSLAPVPPSPNGSNRPVKAPMESATEGKKPSPTPDVVHMASEYPDPVIPPLDETPIQPRDPFRSIASIRRSIWMLMADIEDMSEEGRADLVNDLALLDAAAHSAHGLATGELNVA